MEKVKMGLENMTIHVGDTTVEVPASVAQRVITAKLGTFRRPISPDLAVDFGADISTLVGSGVKPEEFKNPDYNSKAQFIFTTIKGASKVEFYPSEMSHPQGMNRYFMK